MKAKVKILAVLLLLMMTVNICAVSLIVLAQNKDDKTITAIANYTDSEINMYNGVNWGMPSGSRNRETKDGKNYLHYVNRSGYGRARVPEFAESDRNWADVKYIQFEVINNTNSMGELLTYFCPATTTLYYLKDLSQYKVHFNDGTTEWEMSNSMYTKIPAFFKGTVSIPVSASAADYSLLEGGSPWNIQNILQVGVYFRGAADFSIGDYRLIYSMQQMPQVTQKRVSHVGVFSEVDAAEGNNINWGLPNGGTKKLVDAGTKKYVQVKSTDAGRAIFPAFDTANTNFTGAKAVDIEMINNKNVNVKISPYFFVNETTTFSLKAGQRVELITDRWSVIQTIPDNGLISVPSHFNGKIRLPMDDSGGAYGKLWGGEAFNIVKITRVCYEISASSDLLVGDVYLLYRLPVPSVNEFKTMVNVAAFSEEDVKEGDRIDWGLPMGEKSLVDVNGQKYIRIVSQGPGRAILPLGDPYYYDWTDAKAVDIEVINNSSTPTKIAPQLFINETTPYSLTAGNTVQFLSDGKITSYTMSDIYISVPPSFQGTMRMPVNNSGSNYFKVYGTDQFDIKKVTRVCYEVPSSLDLSVGDVKVQYVLPPIQNDGYKTVFDPAFYTQEQISDGDDVSWGLPGGKKTLVNVGTEKYIKIVSKDSGRAVLPAMDLSNRDWTDAKVLDISVINTKPYSQKIAPYYFIDEKAPLVRKPLVTVELISDNLSIKQTSRESFVVIPADFKGIVRLTLKADGSDVSPLWGTEKFNIANISRMGFVMPKDTELLVGNMTLRYVLPKTQQSLSQQITCIAAMTENDVNECVGTTWGIFKGSMGISNIGTQKYIEVVSNREGKAVLPPVDLALRDWTNAKYVDIPIINNKAAVEILPYVYVDDKTPFLMKPGTKVQLVSMGTIREVTLTESTLTLPTDFSGVLRIPLNNQGSNFETYWGSGKYDVTKISRVCIELKHSGSILVGDMTLHFSNDIPIAPTGDMIPCVSIMMIAAIWMAATITLKKRKRAKV